MISEALEKIVREQLSSVPDDHHIALVTVVNGDSAKAVFMWKPNHDWQVQSYVEVRKEHGLDYGASVQFSR